MSTVSPYITLYFRILSSPSAASTPLFPLLFSSQLPSQDPVCLSNGFPFSLSLFFQSSLPIPNPIPPIGVTCLLYRATVLLWSMGMKFLCHGSYQGLRYLIA